MKLKYLSIILAITCFDTVKADDAKDSKSLDDIIITADLRAGTTQRETTTSLTVLDDDTLKKAGQQHFQDVMELVPNLNWSSATNRPRYFQIRGIGERSQYEGAPNPSVGFIVDDMDFSGLGGVATLFGVEQIEILRGPQGTRYGANALAGLIYVKTKDPSNEPAYQLQTLWGNDGDRALGFSATGALNEKGSAAYRFSLNQFNANGFRYNDYYDINDSNQKDEFVSRGKIKWQASDDLTLDLTVLLTDINNGFDTFNPENIFITHSDDLGRDEQRSVGLGLRTNWTGAKSFDLISISSSTRSDVLYFFDGDWGNDDYWAEFAPYDFTSKNRRNRKNISQEFRLVSKADARIFNDSSDWIVGLYLLDLKEDNQFNDFFNDAVARDLNSEFNALSSAIFAQIDSHLTAQTTLTTGLRFEHRSAEYIDSNGLNLSPSDSMIGGQISLNHTLNDYHNIYTTLSRGYKAGGFNLSPSLADERRQYEPEFLLNLEAGIKGYFLDYRLSLNISAFYAKRTDMQVSTSIQSDPTDPLTFIFFTGNAASGKNYGLEADWRYSVSRNFSLHGSLGLLRATFVDYVTVDADFSGKEQAQAPNYQFNLGAEYIADGGFFARVDINGRDGFYYSDSHDQKSDAYSLVNFKLGYEAQSWALYLWGRNIFNKQYTTRGFFFGLEPPDYPNTLYTQLGDPSHFGISAEFNF